MKKTDVRKAKKEVKKQKKIWIILMPIYFCVSIFIMEMAVKLSIENVVLDLSILYTLLFSVFTGLLLYFFLSLFGIKTRKVLTAISLGILSIVFASQLIYYEVFKTFYSFYSASEGVGQILQFYKEILSAIWDKILLFIIIFLPFIAWFFLPKRFKNLKKYKIQHSLIILLTGVLAFIFSLIPINFTGKEPNSAYDLYYKNSYPVYSVMRLGVMTTMRLDMQRNVFGFEATAKEPEFIFEPTKEPSPTPEETIINVSPTPTLSPLEEFNMMDIDFDKLILETNDDILKSTHKYFSNVIPTKKNKYTGIFKGYNLILITGESYSHYAIDENITPTFYKMTHDGIYFTNFYNPIWNVSTSDGEYVATTGLIPKLGVWSMKQSGSNYLPFTMGNQLKQLGFDTYAYHNHSYKYYARDISHPNLGYIYKGVGNGLKVKKTWPESDLEMMEVTIPEYINSEKFHAYYMTVSGHLAYNFFGNAMSVKNKDIVKDLPYTEPAKAYLAANLELDRALEYLLKKLEEAGVAEKTLIVLSGDHYPYGLKKEDLDNLAGHTVEGNFELHKSSLILYVKGMKPMQIDEPISSLDIIPTISNLLGLEYDSRLMMGRDVFAGSDPLVIFNNRSFITEKGKYNSLTKKFIPEDGVTVEEDYVKDMLNEIEGKFYFSTKILDLDYYAKVIKKD